MELKQLASLRLFNDMSQADIELFAASCEERMLMSDEILFNEGGSDNSIWMVLSGRVDIFKNIRGDVDRILASLGAGESIGEMGFVDGSCRSASARTTEPSTFMVLSRQGFNTIEKEHPSIAAVFYRNLSIVLTERLRSTIELYRESVAFCIEATGAGKLNLLALSEELKPVTILLGSGANISGHILQMDQTPAGYTIVIKDKNGKLGIIPYNAIQQIMIE
jgi:CRP-like cAMP-binding protein